MEQERETYLKLGKNIRRYRLAKDVQTPWCLYSSGAY